MSWGLYFNGYDEYKTYYLTYDDNSGGKVAQAGVSNVQLGDDKKNNANYFSRPIANFEVYFGVERSTKKGHIKHLSAGLMATRAGYRDERGQYVQFSTVKNIDDTVYDHDWYGNRNIAVGLKIGVGLW